MIISPTFLSNTTTTHVALSFSSMHTRHLSYTIIETDALDYGSLVDYSVMLYGWKIVRLYRRGDDDDEVEPPVTPAEDSVIFDFQPY